MKEEMPVAIFCPLPTTISKPDFSGIVMVVIVSSNRAKTAKTNRVIINIPPLSTACRFGPYKTRYLSADT